MSDMSQVIIPKSDQINADDLIAGPMTVKITSVKVSPGVEQPVSIYFEGSDKAYRCCKSMARVLVTAWGADSSKYIGRSLTLYCDPKVKWGGMEVGGIRISHMSDIKSPLTLALTMTRANKKPFTVQPLRPASTQSGSDPSPEHSAGGASYKATLEQAATLEELAAAWSKVPKFDKPALEAVKNARKDHLSTPTSDAFRDSYEQAEQSKTV